MERQMDGCLDGKTDEWMDSSTGEWMKRWLDEWTAVYKDRWTDRWIDGQINRWVDEWVDKDGWIGGWTGGWLVGQVDGRTDRWMDEVTCPISLSELVNVPWFLTFKLLLKPFKFSHSSSSTRTGRVPRDHLVQPAHSTDEKTEGQRKEETQLMAHFLYSNQAGGCYLNVCHLERPGTRLFLRHPTYL